MGWWKIESIESGQIDWDSGSENGLVNAIPGRDPKDNLYNGDGPADIMQDIVDFVYGNIDGKVNQKNITKLILECKLPAALSVKNEKKVISFIKKGWKKIEEEYLDEWKRKSSKDEKLAICNFILNPMFNEEYQKEKD